MLEEPLLRRWSTKSFASIPMTTIPTAVGFIVIVEFCERLCYFVFAGTQKTWLQDRGFSNAQSSSINLIFGMLSFISCFFGGWLASTSVGRFRTIAVLGGVYALGTLCAAVASWPGNERLWMYLFGTLVLVTFGAGGIKPNVVTHGADQFDPDDPELDKHVKAYFQYFYLSINMGSAVSHGILSSTAVSGLPALGVPVRFGFVFTYTVGASFMLLALLIFIAGKGRYRPSVVKGDEGVFKIFTSTVWEGRHCRRGQAALVGWFLIPIIILTSLLNAFMRSVAMQRFCIFLDVACITCLVLAHLDPDWLPIGGVRDCLARVPVLLVGCVFYGTMESSVGSFFQSEACQMDTRLHRGDEDSFQLSGDFFRLANPLTIVLWTPFLIKVVFPKVTKLIGHEPTAGAKVCFGYLFALLSQLTALLLEWKRRNSSVSGVPSRCAPILPDGSHVLSSEMSALWMLLPFAISGMGEILVYPVLMHVAYDAAPPEMKSLMQAFTLFSLGALSNATAAGVSQAVGPLVPNNLNDGNLCLVYLINITIGISGLVLFIFTWRRTRKYQQAACHDTLEETALRSAMADIDLALDFEHATKIGAPAE